MNGIALTPEDITTLRQSQQAAFVRLLNDLIADVAELDRPKTVAAAEQKAKLLYQLARAAQAVNAVIDQFGETEMDEDEQTQDDAQNNETREISTEEYRARFEAKCAEIYGKLDRLARTLRDTGSLRSPVDGTPSADGDGAD
ncbi:MAG: hypothetical protein QM667_14125 [Asticcacaulis sp.]